MAISVANQWTGTAGTVDIEQTITPTAGNWLVATVAWRTASPAVQPVINQTDTSRNLWYLLATRTKQAAVTNPLTGGYINVQVWACPAATFSGWPSLRVYTAIQTFTASDMGSVCVNIAEIAGMGNGFLTVDSITTGISGLASSMSVTSPTPAADCLFVAGVVTDWPTSTTITSTGTGFTALTRIGNSNPNITLNAAWKESAAAVTASWTASNTVDWGVVLVGIRQTGTAPAQSNPNWPVVETQLGFGYTMSTPLSAVWWTTLTNAVPAWDTKRGIPYELNVAQAEPTDLTIRNADGGLSPQPVVTATASAAGTTTTILVPDAQASGITVGDFFQLMSGGVPKEFTAFKVTGLSSAGGTTTITFTVADGSGGGALAATVSGDVYQGTPVDLYTPYRVLASWGGKRHCVTAGWAEQWPETWDASGYVGSVQMTGTGTLANLTAANPTCLAGEIMRRNPHSYWPLGDAQGATQAQNLSGRGTAPLVVTVSSAGASGTNAFGVSTQGMKDTAPTPPTISTLLGDPGNGWQQTGIPTADINANLGSALVANDTNFPPIANGVTIFFVHAFGPNDLTSYDGTHTATLAIFRNTDASAGATGSVIKLSWSISGTGSQLSATVWDRSTHASTATALTGGNGWAFKNTFRVTALAFNKTTWKVYTGDGGLAGSGTCNLADKFSIVDVAGEADAYFNGNIVNGIFAHVVLYDRMLSDAEVSTLYSATYGHSGDEYTANRVQRKLDTIGMKAARTISTAGQRVCSVEGTDGSTIADINNIIGSYEDALVFEDASGAYQYRPPELYTTQTSRATLGERADLGEIPYQAGVVADYDATYIYNSITASNTVKSQQAWESTTASTLFTAVNSTSVQKYSLRSMNRDTRLNNNSDVTHLTSRLLSRYATRKFRISAISVDPASNPNAWPFCLTVEVGDIVTVMRRPLNGAAISIVCQVLQVAHATTPGAWKTTLTLAPAP